MDDNTRHEQINGFIDEYRQFNNVCKIRGMKDNREIIALYYVYTIEELAKTMRSDLDE